MGKKMKILIVDRKLQNDNWPFKEGQEFYDAFKKLDHDVTIAGKDYEVSESKIQQCYEDNKFDFCLITENYWDDWSWFDFSKIHCPKLFWAIDYDHTRYAQAKIIQNFCMKNKFSHIFVIDTKMIESGKQITGINHSYLPYATSDKFCEKSINKDVDVGFIGSPYDDRVMMFPKNTQYINGVIGDKYLEAISRIKINLNYSITNGMNGKVFEILGCKGFLLTNNTHDSHKMFGNFLPLYESRGDLMEKVDYYLKHDNERDKIRYTCYDYVMKNETYVQRAEKIIELIFMKDYI